MKKIDIGEYGVPRIINPSGRLFDNARGGPYKYGLPIVFNKAAIDRIQSL